jgi:hypothetical protein
MLQVFRPIPDKIAGNDWNEEPVRVVRIIPPKQEKFLKGRNVKENKKQCRCNKGYK